MMENDDDDDDDDDGGERAYKSKIETTSERESASRGLSVPWRSIWPWRKRTSQGRAAIKSHQYHAQKQMGGWTGMRRTTLRVFFTLFTPPSPPPLAPLLPAPSFFRCRRFPPLTSRPDITLSSFCRDEI